MPILYNPDTALTVPFDSTGTDLSATKTETAIKELYNRVRRPPGDILEIWVDAAAGDNNNDGLSEATALAHPYKADEILNQYDLEGVEAVIIIKPGTYNFYVAPGFQFPPPVYPHLKISKKKGKPKAIVYKGTSATEIIFAFEEKFGDAIEIDAGVGKDYPIFIQDIIFDATGISNVNYRKSNAVRGGHLVFSKVQSKNVTWEFYNAQVEWSRIVANHSLEVFDCSGTDSESLFAFFNCQVGRYTGAHPSSVHHTNLAVSNQQDDLYLTNVDIGSILNFTDSTANFDLKIGASPSLTKPLFKATRSKINYPSEFDSLSSADSIRDELSLVNNSDFDDTIAQLGVATKKKAIDELTNRLTTVETNLGDLAAQKGQPEGIAELDSNGKVPTEQLPAIAITNVEVVADIPARDALIVETGDTVKVVDSDGNGNSQTYIYDGTSYIDVQETSDVISVNGKTKTVVLKAEDLLVTATQTGYSAASPDVEGHLAGIHSAIALLSLKIGTEKNSNFTATVGNLEPVNVSDSSVIVSPPPNPQVNNRFAVVDSRANSFNHNIVVDFAGATQKLYGSSDNYTFNENGAYTEFKYLGGDIGWITAKG